MKNILPIKEWIEYVDNEEVDTEVWDDDMWD